MRESGHGCLRVDGPYLGHIYPVSSKRSEMHASIYTKVLSENLRRYSEVSGGSHDASHDRSGSEEQSMV